MDIKKSKFLEDRFKLSSFSLKIYNVNAGNRRYASVSSARTGAKIHQIANQKRSYIEKYVNIIYALGLAHVKFDVWIEVDLLPFYSTQIVGFHMTSLKLKLRNYRSYRDLLSRCIKAGEN